MTKSSDRNCLSCAHGGLSTKQEPCYSCEWTPKAASDKPSAALPENPKAIHGRAKPNLALIPGGAAIPVSKVFQLGAEKYGPFNWRKDPVQAETYMAAAQRHMLSWFDGEDQDEESGQSHLAHAACCMMIVLDAMATGKLIDNRPHKGTSADLIRALTKPLETTS